MSDKFLSEDTQFEGQFSKTLFTTLKWAYRPFLGRLIFIFVIGFLSRILMLGQANVIGLWVDSLNAASKQQSNDYLYILISMSILGLAGTLTYRILFSRFSAFAVSQIYDETTYRTSRFPMLFFDQTPVGRITTRFSSDYGSVFRLFGGPIAEFVALIFDLLAMIILITVASPYYLIVMLVIFISHYFVYRSQIENLRRLRRSTSRLRSPSIAHFSETTQGVSLIRLFLKQTVFSERFQTLEAQYQSIRKILLINLSQFAIFMNLTSVFCFFITGFLAWLLIQNHLITIGSLTVAFGFVVASGHTIQMFFDWMTQMEEAVVGLERLDHFIQSPIEDGARLPADCQIPTSHWKYEVNNLHADKINFLNSNDQQKGHVVFNQVSLKYSDDLPWVLKDVNFQVHPKEKFGIIGRTGSGKSSLIQALFYLYPPQKGFISIDQHIPDLKSFSASPLLNDNKNHKTDLKKYRSQIAYISQEPTLIKGTLRENLDLNSEHTMEEIFNVLSQVGLEYWANENSLQFMIEEKGKNLSQGEKQLICMARCLLQKSSVVIMDEATSNVDPQSEQIIVDATENFFKDRTVIIIAHRLTTLKNCDRVLWLHQGHIQMLGTPDQVLPIFQQSNQQT